MIPIKFTTKKGGKNSVFFFCFFEKSCRVGVREKLGENKENIGKQGRRGNEREIGAKKKKTENE